MKVKKVLKSMGLMAGKKKTQQMINVGIVVWALFVLVIIFSVIGK